MKKKPKFNIGDSVYILAQVRGIDLDDEDNVTYSVKFPDSWCQYQFAEGLVHKISKSKEKE